VKTEITLARLVKTKVTPPRFWKKMAFRHNKSFLPLQHGFDGPVGLPYSNDMWRFGTTALPQKLSNTPQNPDYPPLPLIEGEDQNAEHVGTSRQS
jgi:hypothetical protein